MQAETHDACMARFEQRVRGVPGIHAQNIADALANPDTRNAIGLGFDIPGKLSGKKRDGVTKVLAGINKLAPKLDQ